MRRLVWTLALLLLGVSPVLADGRGFAICTTQPYSAGPYGDGTTAGELFALYAEEINPDVLVYPEELFEPEPAPRGFDTEEAHVKGEGWYDPYATEGPGA